MGDARNTDRRKCERCDGKGVMAERAVGVNGIRVYECWACHGRGYR